VSARGEHDFAHGHGFHRHARTSVRARQDQQLADHARHAVGLAADVGQRALAECGVSGAHPGHQIGVQQHAAA
jgi:hypothetical protein